MTLADEFKKLSKEDRQDVMSFVKYMTKSHYGSPQFDLLSRAVRERNCRFGHRAADQVSAILQGKEPKLHQRDKVFSTSKPMTEEDVKAILKVICHVAGILCPLVNEE